MARGVLIGSGMNPIMSLGTIPGAHLDRVLARHERAARRTRLMLFIVLALAMALPLLLV